MSHAHDAAGPTLRELTGMPTAPAPLSDSTLVLIDLQNTYTRGVMALDGVEDAVDEAAALLDRARTAGRPVVHVQHDAGPGSPYDVREDIGAIIDRVAPRDGEPVVVKQYPDAFAGTDLAQRLRGLGTDDLVVVGFMTHMCVNSTTRAGFTAGFSPTVVAAATATRDLPGPAAAVPAASVQSASLAALADMFAVVVDRQADVPD